MSSESLHLAVDTRAKMTPVGHEEAEQAIDRDHADPAIGSKPTDGIAGTSIVQERLNLLANVLFVAAAVILVLALITALALASSPQTLGIFETFERQSRDLAALATLGAGVAGAALVAGVGGILKALLQVISAEEKRHSRAEKSAE